MNRSIAYACLAGLALAMAAACAGNPVKSDGAWAEGAVRGKGYSRLLVVGVSPDINQRCAFEDSLAQALRSAGAGAETSCSVLGSKEPLTREAVEKGIAAMTADAVLAARPLGGSARLQEGGTRETRGAGYYKATDFGYAYDYWGAYGVPVVYGQFQTAPAEYFLEGSGRVRVDVFDTTGATLVYTAQVEASRLESRTQGMLVITSAITDQLGRDGLIR